jgi:hypothetical protein
MAAKDLYTLSNRSAQQQREYNMNAVKDVFAIIPAVFSVVVSVGDVVMQGGKWALSKVTKKLNIILIHTMLSKV